jgi:hypothetical protein
MTNLELEYIIAQETLREAEESFDKLRKDYHALREYTDMLETLLRSHGIDYPEFCGW